MLVRQDLIRHEERDDERFDRLELAVGTMNSQLERFVGGIELAKWALGLGIPAILAALITNIVRHW